MASWIRARRLAAWLAGFIGRWSLVIATAGATVAFLAVPVGDALLHDCYNQGPDCNQVANAVEDIALGVAVLGGAGFLAALGCGAAYVSHRFRIRHLAVVNAPRLQGWKDWAAEGRVTDDDYAKAAPLLAGWMDGTDPHLLLRLGATYLRRIGYVGVALAAVAAVIAGEHIYEPNDGEQRTFLVLWGAVAPIALAVSYVLIAAGIALGRMARRDGEARQAELEALEANVLSRPARPAFAPIPRLPRMPSKASKASRL